MNSPADGEHQFGGHVAFVKTLRLVNYVSHGDGGDGAELRAFDCRRRSMRATALGSRAVVNVHAQESRVRQYQDRHVPAHLSRIKGGLCVDEVRLDLFVPNCRSQYVLRERRVVAGTYNGLSEG